MSRLYSDIKSILEHFTDYEYNSRGVDKSTVKRRMDDVVYRAMSFDELEEIILKSQWEMSRNDLPQRFWG